jgi:N-acetylglucosamine-6-phosphate deacetylase
MNTSTFVNGRVLLDGEFQSDRAVIVEDGFIAAILPSAEVDGSSAPVTDLGGGYLLPGFIDIQVNGGGGVLFNDDPTVEGISTIARAHRQFGTTGLLPTLISDDLDVIHQALNAAECAIDAGVPGILGIHIEGPFLSQERSGVHDITKLRKLTEQIICDLEPLERGCSLLTLAPETVEPGMIRTLVDKGFIVSCGHSNATYEAVTSAVNQGLTGFTHLYNAMSQLGVRTPGVVGAALDEDRAWCGIIVDGHHVSPAAIRIAWRCKGPKKLILVSDAMPLVGSEKSEFSLMGKRVTVTDGYCIDANGTLAGTALEMASAVRNMIDTTKCSLADGSTMASASPAAFLGLEQQMGHIRTGTRADLVVLDSELQVRQTMIGGLTEWIAS